MLIALQENLSFVTMKYGGLNKFAGQEWCIPYWIGHEKHGHECHGKE